MGRLRVARPAGTLAARCAPVAPSTLGLPRLWQQCGASVAARPSCFTPQREFRTDKPTRYTQPADEPQINRVAQADTEGSIVSWTRSSVKIRTRTGPGVMMDSLWLRDACPCPRCVDPNSGQKTFSTTDLPDQPKVGKAFMNADGSLEVVFVSDPLSGGKTHESTFSASEVKSWVDGATGIRGSFSGPTSTIPWNKSMYESMVAEGSCRISYNDWMNNDSEAFWAAFADLSKTGLIIVTDVPQVENEVEAIAKQIGPLQYTFYGWTWDVKSKPKAENVAYTSQFLGLHQDLMYHTPIPKIQLLHCLENSCEGGESLFSHGVRAAHELRLTAPEEYQTLVKNATQFAYQKNGHHYFQRHTTIKESIKGYPSTTYWAPPFQTTFRKRSGAEFATLREWKTAATSFQQILESPHNMIEVKLQPGECVIFDNRRILHGRREFATKEGSRWLKGCYIEPSVFYAKETQLGERVKQGSLKAHESLQLAEKEAQMVEETMPEGWVKAESAPPPRRHTRPRGSPDEKVWRPTGWERDASS